MKNSNEPATFPKLDVVLAVYFLNSTSRRLLVNAVKLCGADHSPAAVHHEHFVPHDGSPIQKGTVIVTECRSKAVPNKVQARGGNSATPA
ncbi:MULTISPECIES: hypothetical protein [unclassified Bradyrhizobium]|uniref:hypothetical protein n=1 Tax=unclassified Bradyrhizobium TaxID=2631580 RepID=UPI00244AEBDB|nr:MULTISPECIES: hypothetical protein [unclassified Bradyrhizobium]MDH2347189.1 hypothetical protein [Bradyrhizobium sp. SSUT77]MDH2356332.1 hypothetical protein [Bradyrhizobium sp. SSUT112]